MLNRKSLGLVLLALFGLVLLFLSVHTALYVGETWFTDRAYESWHLNNYIVVPGWFAYVFGAFVPTFLAGLFMAVCVPAFFSRSLLKEQKYLFVFFLLAVGCGALGFNTFDYMLGCFYWTNGVDPSPVLVDMIFTSFSLNAWNFYFFWFLVPLGLSGFCIGASVIYCFFGKKKC